jgi:hypothetical protein
MRKLSIIVIACILFGSLGARAVLAENVVVGVNVVGVDQLSEAQQDALVAQLHRDGVTTVRLGFGSTFQHFIIHAYQNGIGTVAILYPMQGSSGPLRPADPAIGLTWRQQGLSDASPESFRKWLVPQLAALEAFKGKVLLVMNNDPDWDPDLFAGKKRLYYGRWSYKYQMGARLGAAGVIIIHTTPSAGYPFQVVQTSWSGEQVELPPEGEPRIQVKSWFTEDAARKLVALSGSDLDKLVESARSKDFKPVPLGVTTSLDFRNTVKRSTTANVYGMLRGSDPKVADE